MIRLNFSLSALQDMSRLHDTSAMIPFLFAVLVHFHVPPVNNGGIAAQHRQLATPAGFDITHAAASMLGKGHPISHAFVLQK